MRRGIIILIGLAVAAMGALWTFQGLGYVKGSPMTGVSFWATVGPIVAGLGLALAIVGLRKPRK
jgi:hypothetical protein